MKSLRSVIISLLLGILVVSTFSGINLVLSQTEASGNPITVRNMIQLTSEPVYQANPSWSPDGSRIVYVQDPVDSHGMGDIWIMKADGSDKTPLVTNPAWDEGPSWAPDGSRIAFISNRYVWPGSMFIKDLITGDEISLPYEGSQNYVAHPKCWSPDGSKILFITNRITGEVDNCDLWIMDSDGSNQKPLTSGGGIIGACFSPDGKKIVYSQNNDIFIMNADGSNKQKIISNGIQPVFSPDGKWIAFVRSEGYRASNIWVAELENPSNQIQLTTTNDARSPDWSPDGTKIAFTRGWDQEADIWIIEIEFTLTTTPEYEIWAVSSTEPSYPVVIYNSRKVLFGAPIFENLEHYYNILPPNESRIQSLELFLLDIIHAISGVERPSVAIFEPDMLDNLDEWLNAANDWTFLINQLWTAEIALSNWQQNGYISYGELIDNLSKLFDAEGRAYDVLIIDQCMQADTPIFSDEMIDIIQNFHRTGGAIIVSGTVFVNWASIVRLWRGEPDLPYWYQGPINDKLLSVLFPGVGLDRTEVVVQEDETEVHYLAVNSPSAIPTPKAPTTLNKVDTLGVSIPYPYNSHGFMKIVMLKAKILLYSVSSGEFKPGDQVSAQVTVMNFGEEPWTFYVGFSVQDSNGKWWDAPYKAITLNPNEEGTVTLYWTVPSEAPSGYYNARVAVWGGKEDDRLVNLLDYRDEFNVFEVVKPDFKISVTPYFQRINPGDKTVFTIHVEPLGGFSLPVRLSYSLLGGPEPSLSVIINPSTIVPPGDSEIVVTSESGTPLGRYKIEIKANSDGIEHTTAVILQVGYAIEVLITRFQMKQDVDLLWLDRWADVYFTFNIKGIDDDGDGIIDESGDCFRVPSRDYEIMPNDCSNYAGPPYIVHHLVSIPFSITIRALDWDPIGDLELASFSFDVEDLPCRFGLDNDYIRFEGVVEELSSRNFTVEYTTNDPLNNDQWYWFEIDVDKVLAEFNQNNFEEVTVAVLDTGIDYGHPDLQGAFWLNNYEIPNDGIDNDGNGYVDDFLGWDFLENDNDPSPYRGEGRQSWDDHGTMVAGIIAAAIDNQEGIAGIAWNAKIMNLRVGGSVVEKGLWYEEAKFIQPTPERVARAIRYAVDKGADVISISWGTTGWNEELVSAVQYAYKHGVVVVAGIGNWLTSIPTYPASLGNVIGVSGVARYRPVNDRVLSEHDTSILLNFTYLALWVVTSEQGSNYGEVKLSAPAYHIWTTKDHICSPSYPYEFVAGTSLATPIVTGITSLVLGYIKHKYPSVVLSPNEVRYILQSTAFDIGPEGWDPYYGYGLIDAYKAITKVDELFGKGCWQIRLDPTCNLDLHIFDAEGRHIGLNYTTKEIEIEIPGATYTGDEKQGFETAFLPLNISSFRIEIVGKDISSANYTLTICYLNEKGQIERSLTFGGVIAEGIPYCYLVKGIEFIKQDPLEELKHFDTLIWQLPEEVFKSSKLSKYLKKALSNKISEVILKIENGEYHDALEKLLNDILPKTDGNPRPEDWIIDQHVRDKLIIIIEHIANGIRELEMGV